MVQQQFFWAGVCNDAPLMCKIGKSGKSRGNRCSLKYRKKIERVGGHA
jgi:hypothetical protein